MRRDTHVEERKHSKHLLRGRRKLDFHKDSLPLAKKTFYLDLKGYRQVKTIENDLKLLGGTIETFLSKEINYFITNQPFKPKEAKERNASATSAGSPAISTPSPFSNMCPTSSAGARTSISRGKSMIQRAKIDAQATRILENAQKWGVKIVAIHAVQKWIVKEKEKLGTTKRETAKPKTVTKRNTTSKFSTGKRLQSPFVKFEAAHLQYRPIQQQLSQWPAIGLQTPAGTCPFDGTTIGHGQRSERAERPGLILDGVGRITSGSAKHGSLKKNQSNGDSVGFSGMHNILTAGDMRRMRERKRQAERKKGFCECCQVKYEDLDKHLRNDDHRRFVRNPAHYTSLDSMIVQTYDVSSFLQDALSKQRSKADMTKKYLCLSPLVDDVSLISELSPYSAHKPPARLSAVSPRPVTKQLFRPIVASPLSANKQLTKISKRSPHCTSKKLSRWSCKKSGELTKSSHKRSLFRLDENCQSLKNVCNVSTDQDNFNKESVACEKKSEEKSASSQKKSASIISLKNIVSPSAIRDENKTIKIVSSKSPATNKSLNVITSPGVDRVDNTPSLSSAEHSSTIQLKPEDNSARSPSPIFKKAKRLPRIKHIDLLVGTEIELVGEFAMSAYDKVKLRHRKSSSVATSSETADSRKTPNTSITTPQSQRTNDIPSSQQSQRSNDSQSSQQMKAVSVVLKHIAMSGDSSVNVSSDTIPYKIDIEALSVCTRASSVEFEACSSERNSICKGEHSNNDKMGKSKTPEQPLSRLHENDFNDTVNIPKSSGSKELCIKVVDIFDKSPVLNPNEGTIKLPTMKRPIDISNMNQEIMNLKQGKITSPKDETVSTPSSQTENKPCNTCTPKMSSGDHIRLAKRCKLLSDRSVQKVLSSEMASESFNGFTREQTKSPHFVDEKSDVSFVEVSELSIPADDRYEWDYTGIEAAPPNISGNGDLGTHFLVDTACTVSEDSSWGDACDKFVTSHISSSIIQQKTGSLLSSSNDKTTTRSQSKNSSQMESPSKREKENMPSRFSSPSSKNPSKSPLRTPTRRTARKHRSESSSQTVCTQCKTENANNRLADDNRDFDALGVIRIDDDIQFNYNSPQKTRLVLKSSSPMTHCRSRKRGISHLDDVPEKPRSRRKLLRSSNRSTSGSKIATTLAS